MHATCWLLGVPPVNSGAEIESQSAQPPRDFGATAARENRGKIVAENRRSFARRFEKWEMAGFWPYWAMAEQLCASCGRGNRQPSGERPERRPSRCV
jgi:hypothetical protein